MLCVVLGIRCLVTHDAFDCLGLLTVFPLAFAAVSVISAAVGLQRFTGAGRQRAARRPISLGDGWQPVRPRLPEPRGSTGLPDVLELPGRQEPPGENETSTSGDGADA